MRVGSNPAKADNSLQGYGLHRVIVPVYIPHQEGYFAQSLDVLRLCLDSLEFTTDGLAAVTVVTNGCAPEVLDEIDGRYRERRIDQVVHNRENRGKVDSVVPIARGAFEPLITFSDCDVLFRAGWVEGVQEVFYNFPECGFVSPFPSPGGEGYYTSATLLGALVRRELRIERVTCDADLDRFARSIQKPDHFSAEARSGQLVIHRGSAAACVGGGHFVCTVRKEVIDAMPRHPSLKAIVGDSEKTWFDIPPDRSGYWRLATTRAFVQHMGNIPEPWMYDDLDVVRSIPPPPFALPRPLPPPRRPWVRLMPFGLRTRLASRLIIPRFHASRARTRLA